MKSKSLLMLLGALVTWTVSVLPASAQLNMLFTNSSSYADSNVWVTIQRNTAATNPVTGAFVPDITLGGVNLTWSLTTNIVTTYTNTGTVSNPVIVTNYITNIGSVYSDPVQLSTIKADGGLTFVSNAPSVAVVISYGAAIPVSSYAISTISPSATADASYNIPYQNFEITYTPSSGDQGDATAINYFTAPIGISSYASSNATGAALQSIGYVGGYGASNTQTIYSQLAALTGSNPAAIQFQITGSSNPVTNTSAPMRVLGPTSFPTQTTGATNDNGPYSNFNAYFSNQVVTGNQTILSNSSAYNNVPIVASNAPYNNMGVSFVMTNTVQSLVNGYQLSAVGTITAVFTYYDASHSATNIVTNTYNNVTFTVNPTANNLTNVASAFVYGGSASQYPANAQMGGSGWTSFQAAASGYVSSGADSSNAASIVAAQIPGELAAAFAFGFAGSTNTVAQYGTNQLGNLPSGDWWALTNPVAFSQIQTNGSFYDPYGNVIFNATSNSVYGYAYSDRFIYAPSLVNSVLLNNTNVNSWLITIGDPLYSVPEPSAYFLFGLGALAVIIACRRRAS